MAQSLERPALGFDSGHDFRDGALRQALCLARSLHEILSLLLPLLLPQFAPVHVQSLSLSLFLSLSQINKSLKKYPGMISQPTVTFSSCVRQATL